MLDVAIAPLLWRLDHYGIELPRSAAPLMKYAERIFCRQGFIDAMTPVRKGDAALIADPGPCQCGFGARSSPSTLLPSRPVLARQGLKLAGRFGPHGEISTKPI